MGVFPPPSKSFTQEFAKHQSHSMPPTTQPSSPEVRATRPAAHPPVGLYAVLTGIPRVAAAFKNSALARLDTTPYKLGIKIPGGDPGGTGRCRC